MNSFKRQQLKQLVDQLPENKLDDAIKTMTEMLERPDFAQYYGGIPILDPENKSHMKRLLDMVNKETPPTPEKRPVLKLVDKE